MCSIKNCSFYLNHSSQEATPEEIRSLNGLNSLYVPYIEYAVPELGKILAEMEYHLFVFRSK